MLLDLRNSSAVASGSMGIPKRAPVTSKAWPWLAEQMNARGWRQPQLAAKMGYEVATISRWLSGGIKTPDPAALDALATAFDIGRDTVVGPIDTMRDESSTKARTGPLPPTNLSGETYRDLPSGQHAERSQEGIAVDEWSDRARGFLSSLPPALRPEALDVLEEWRSRKRIRHTGSPPQPAAGRPQSRRRKGR